MVLAAVLVPDGGISHASSAVGNDGARLSRTQKRTPLLSKSSPFSSPWPCGLTAHAVPLRSAPPADWVRASSFNFPTGSAAVLGGSPLLALPQGDHGRDTRERQPQGTGLFSRPAVGPVQGVCGVCRVCRVGGFAAVCSARWGRWTRAPLWSLSQKWLSVASAFREFPVTSANMVQSYSSKGMYAFRRPYQPTIC